MVDINNPRHPGDDDDDDDDKVSRTPDGGDFDFEDDLDGEFPDDFADDDFADDEFADDDFADDEDDEDDDDDEVLSELQERFQGDDYRIVDLKDLTSLDDIEDEILAEIEPGLTFEEVLYRLVREADELPNNELAVFSDLSPADAEQVRRVWPQIDLMRRRSVVAVVTELYNTFLGLDFGAFLRVVLNDNDAIVRRFALLGLAADVAAPDLLGRYVQTLQTDEDSEVRAAAASALGAYILEGELEEMDSALAMRAEQALMAVLANKEEALAVQCRALESLAYSGELGVRQLIEEAYYSSEEAKRLSALVAMGRSADIRWRRLARAELTNPDKAMRAQAAYACGELETKSALPDLLRLLHDSDQRVRLAAIFALGHIGGPQARTALLAVQANGDEVETLAAEEALEEMDFYAGAEAASVPLFDETEADDEEGEEPLDWEDDSDDGEDDDLGEYA